MKKLIESTAAYKTFCRDCDSNRISHAYLLRFDDEINLRECLKLFALKFFGESERTSDGKRILDESFTDFKIYPSPDKKISVDTASAILEDCALKPVERDRKLYVICGFENASALVQNKLLKTLEEPLSGICFILGATTLAPVLDTVRSRAKPLEIPPFPQEQILAALERLGENEKNALAAQFCGGVLGVAQSMAYGDWFGSVAEAANEIYNVSDLAEAGALSAKYGDIKHKKELLSHLNGLFFNALKDGGQQKWTAGALIFAIEKLVSANSDLKFNAWFQGLLYEFMLSVIKENDKWLKLRA